MELRHYASLIWKWLWLILLSTAVAAVSCWLVVKDQPPIYQTSTTVMIGQVIQQADPNWYDFGASEQLAQTYSELIQRELILRATARALGFEEQWRLLKGQIGVNLIPGTQLLEISVVDTDPQRAKRIADELARQLSETVGRAGPEGEHREFIAAQAAIFPGKIQAAQEEVQKLEAELSEAFSARQVQDIQSQINTLQTQIYNWQNTFAQYQLLLGEGSVNVLTVIEEAPVPTRPTGSAWRMQVLLAGAVGMVLAVAAAFVLEYLDDTLKTPDDVTKVMGLTTLGVISRIAGNEPADKLIAVRYPKSPISEAYRVMRTNLQFSSLDQTLQSLVVTSPQPTEGKSTTLANLGVVMARTGKSVILVDSDLRRPTLHKIFQLANREGLTNLLLQDEPQLDGCLQETGVENLSVLTSGPLPPNPSELLASHRMRRLIDRLEHEADMVILDTPPALPVTDAALLAARVNGTLLVTEAGRTRRASARQALDSLNQVGANILGVALNRVSLRGVEGYYHYHYYTYESKGERKRRRRWFHRIPLVSRLRT
jgi:non-specific protein-tyrosine kinase